MSLKRRSTAVPANTETGSFSGENESVLNIVTLSDTSVTSDYSTEYINHTNSEVKKLTWVEKFKRKLRASFSTPSALQLVSSMGTVTSGFGYGKIHDDFDVKQKITNARSRISVPSLQGQPNSWELWWIQSLFWKRGIVLFVFLLAIIGMVQFIVALYFMNLNADKVIDPYVCKTEKCHDLSRWLSESRNMSVSPCENFYDFMCGKHSQTDKGNLKKEWYSNIARLEADGESIIGEILKKNNDPIAQNTIKFYQSCVDIQRKKQAGMKFYIQFLKEIFKDFNLWDNNAKPTLEDIAVQMMHRVGDYGFFEIDAPISYPNLHVRPHKHISQTNNGETKFNEKNLKQFLPMIYDALNIDEEEKREIVTTNLFRMADLLGTIIKHGKPNCTESNAKLDHYFDLQYPIWSAYLGKESAELDPTDPNGKRWKLKEEYKDDLHFTVYPGLTEYKSYQKTFRVLERCWNNIAQKLPVDSIRAVYATFFSVRVLVEVVTGFDDDTIRNYQMESNPLFPGFKAESYARPLPTRCLESLLKTMGFTPIFRYFLAKKDVDKYERDVHRVINETAKSLMKNWLPPEEGGLPYVSSKYRQRAFKILSGKEETSILFPIKEDDHLKKFPKPSKTYPDHMLNGGLWRDYTQNRTFNFWMSKTPKGKLIWHKRFYNVEAVDAYETPGFATYNILKFPVSMFIRPFWENDFLLANYAGAYNLAAKAWLSLVTFDYTETNIKEDIAWRGKKNLLYREGVSSDGGFEKCETLAFDWKFTAGSKFSTEVVDAHSHAFKYGQDIKEYGEYVNSVFPIILATKTAYQLFKERMDNLLKVRFKSLSPTEKRFVMHRKLVNHEQYSEDQLFFMLSMRDNCRTKSESDAFKHHVTDNLVTLMNCKLFAEAWNCPIGSPMNPVSKCFVSPATLDN